MSNTRAAAHGNRAERTAKWKLAAGLMIEEVGDEVLVLNQNAGRIHQFNYTAGIVWRGLMNGDGIEAITAAIVDRFEVPEARARRDAEKMVRNLRILKLIEAEE